MKNLLKILIFFLLTLSFGLSLSFAQPAKEASFYEKLADRIVRCLLCPRKCVIPPSRRGFCGVRENQDGVLYTLSYGRLVSMHIDPIEKKPLFHFLPGSTAFSIATAGCNMTCKFCQNWEISQKKPDEIEFTYVEPAQLVKKAEESGAPVIAYTYTEPSIFYEYMLDIAKLAKKRGLKNIMHSNGYLNEEPLRQLAKYLDAANIDLKGFSDEYYAKLAQGTLEPVLNSLKILKEEGVHIEITNLILPGYNDDPANIRKMCIWIKENLGADTPLHLSRFYPQYQLLALNPTPVAILENARQAALDCGLKYVYIGNVGGHPAESTYCPKCKKVLIKRYGYIVSETHIKDGKCEFCAELIEGIWQ